MQASTVTIKILPFKYRQVGCCEKNEVVLVVVLAVIAVGVFIVVLVQRRHCCCLCGRCFRNHCRQNPPTFPARNASDPRLVVVSKNEVDIVLVSLLSQIVPETPVLRGL